MAQNNKIALLTSVRIDILQPFDPSLDFHTFEVAWRKTASWRPPAIVIVIQTFEYVQADPAELVNVGVVYLGDEPNFGRGHRVILGEKELQLEHAALERRPLWTGNDHFEITRIVVVWYSWDSWHRLLHQTLRLLEDQVGENKSGNIFKNLHNTSWGDFRLKVRFHSSNVSSYHLSTILGSQSMVLNM